MSKCKNSKDGAHNWELSEGSMMFCNNGCIGTPGGDNTVLEKYEIVGYIKELEDIIKALQNPWVSVDDRLPDKDSDEELQGKVSVDVRINYTYLDIDDKRHTAQTDAYLRFASGSWFHSETGIHLGYTITHWQPLPLSPVMLNFEITNDDIGRTNELFSTPSEDKCSCKYVEMRDGGMFCTKCEEPI